jgi:hypothetical protein
MANHVPGEGRLSRPDLLATVVKNYQQSQPEIKVEIDFFPHTYRLYMKNECENYFHLINDPSFKELMKSETYFIWKDVLSKKEVKLDFFEHHNLNSVYRKGDLCGKRNKKARDVIQKYITDQVLLEDGQRFKIRAYLYVASFDPLVAYYHSGHLILNE